ncbi:hypothetical protein LDENG_00151300, partial [Lucifuga dentata]
LVQVGCLSFCFVCLFLFHLIFPVQVLLYSSLGMLIVLWSVCDSFLCEFFAGLSFFFLLSCTDCS